MRRAFAIVLLCVFGFVAGTAPAWAQATGSVTGLVTDESGAVLPGVTVELTNDATGQSRTAVTESDGFYRVPLVQPGKYSVKATLAGFRTAVRQGITVEVNGTARADVQMTVGQVEENVTVTSEAPLVETSNGTMGIVIDQEKVVDLPLNGRNFTQLGTLIPGVVAPPSGLGGQAGDATPGGFGNATGGFNVNGMRNQSNSFLMDGASNNDTFNTGFVLRPPPDAIQEFKILTHSFGAEYGRNAGSVVNVVTKSGTNQVKGGVWEFNRDDSLQARNFFALASQPKPVLQQNQFGAVLGGPIVKNTLFAFGFYEGYRNKSGITQTLTVLTQDQRNGNFGSTAIIDPVTGAAFPGNTIPSNRISPAATKLLKDFMPLPNAGGNRYTVSPTVEDNRNSFGTRFDHRFNDRHSLLARYMFAQTERTQPRTVQPADSIAKARLQDVMGSHTFILKPNQINVLRASFNRIYANPAVTSGLKNADYGIGFQNTNPLATGLPSIAITGFATLGDAQQPFVERVNNVLEVADDYTWLTGRHNIKFGFSFRNEFMKIAFINRPNGDLSFNGNMTGNAAADFLLGYAAQARATTTQAIQEGTGRSWAGYVQDEFRLSSKLTLNLGVRYELTEPFVDKNDAISGFSTGVQSTKFPAAPRGLIYPGDSGVPRGIIPTDKNNFAPRLSAVFDPTGSGKSSVRASWGIFYDALAGQGDFFQSGVLSPPFTPLVEINSSRATFDRIQFANPLGTSGGSANPFPANLTIIGWGQDFQTPYAMHYNLGYQQQLFDRFGAEIAYVGSRGYHLPVFMEINPGVVVAGQTTQGARLMPAFALVRPTFSEAKSWYNSLQASLRMRPTHGLNFLASYTLSHAQDHVSGLNIGGDARPVLSVTQGDQASIDAALAREKGDALFDVRHRFVFSFGYALPEFKDKGAATRLLLGGWQANGIIQGQTGFPFTVTDSVLTIRYLTNRPNVTCDPNDGPKTVQQYFNTSCFSRRSIAQTATDEGNQLRNTVRGPGFSRVDASLFKSFAINARHELQVRVEAFNLLNQARFGQPGNVVSAATFGQITTAEDGRVIQLGVKYSF